MLPIKSKNLRQYLCRKSIERFKESLIERELAHTTIDKYVRDVNRFLMSTETNLIPEWITKQTVVNYKALLVSRYAPTSVNSILTALNCYLDFVGKPGLKVKHIKIQKETYRSEMRELTRKEYGRLVEAACRMGRYRTALIMQALCSTGIRVSELKFFTVESVRNGKLVISNKNKIRYAWLPEKLCSVLLTWAADHDCTSGPLFKSQSGDPLSRVYLWKEMKLVAVAAQVEVSKVYPHNLRHLFACEHYDKYRDIASLCDLLGHARVETTRIYVATTGWDRKEQVANLNLIA